MRHAVTISTPASAESGRHAHHAAEQEHRGKQEHANGTTLGKARLLAGLDRHARARDGRGRGHAAEERQQNITHALRDQLTIRVERFALHARGADAPHSRLLDHAQRRDGHNRAEARSSSMSKGSGRAGIQAVVRAAVLFGMSPTIGQLNPNPRVRRHDRRQNNRRAATPARVAPRFFGQKAMHRHHQQSR